MRINYAAVQRYTTNEKVTVGKNRGVDTLTGSVNPAFNFV
jgi:hypothetical protein